MSSASQDAESANSNSKGSHDSSTSLFSLPLGYAMNALEHHPTATLLGTAAVTTGAGYLFLNSDFYQRNKRWIWGASAVGAAVTGYYTTKKYMPLVQEVWSSGKALMQMAMGRTTDDENKRSVDIARHASVKRTMDASSALVRKYLVSAKDQLNILFPVDALRSAARSPSLSSEAKLQLLHAFKVATVARILTAVYFAAITQTAVHTHMSIVARYSLSDLSLTPDQKGPLSVANRDYLSVCAAPASAADLVTIARTTDASLSSSTSPAPSSSFAGSHSTPPPSLQPATQLLGGSTYPPSQSYSQLLRSLARLCRAVVEDTLIPSPSQVTQPSSSISSNQTSPQSSVSVTPSPSSASSTPLSMLRTQDKTWLTASFTHAELSAMLDFLSSQITQLLVGTGPVTHAALSLKYSSLLPPSASTVYNNIMPSPPASTLPPSPSDALAPSTLSSSSSASLRHFVSQYSPASYHILSPLIPRLAPLGESPSSSSALSLPSTSTDSKDSGVESIFPSYTPPNSCISLTPSSRINHFASAYLGLMENVEATPNTNSSSMSPNSSSPSMTPTLSVLVAALKSPYVSSVLSNDLDRSLLATLCLPTTIDIDALMLTISQQCPSLPPPSLPNSSTPPSPSSPSTTPSQDLQSQLREQQLHRQAGQGQSRASLYPNAAGLVHDRCIRLREMIGEAELVLRSPLAGACLQELTSKLLGLVIDLWETPLSNQHPNPTSSGSSSSHSSYNTLPPLTSRAEPFVSAIGRLDKVFGVLFSHLGDCGSASSNVLMEALNSAVHIPSLCKTIYLPLNPAEEAFGAIPNTSQFGLGGFADLLNRSPSFPMEAGLPQSGISPFVPPPGMSGPDSSTADPSMLLLQRLSQSNLGGSGAGGLESSIPGAGLFDGMSPGEVAKTLEELERLVASQDMNPLAYPPHLPPPSQPKQ